jgi:sugar phosphate permease
MTDYSSAHPGAQSMKALHASSGWIIAFAVVAMLAGIIALASVVMATDSAVFIVGIMLLVAGFAEIVTAFSAKGWGRFFFWLVLGVIYVFAGLGGLWLLFWWKGAHDRPEDCPKISERELKHIVSSRPPLMESRAIPWALILRAPAAWAVFALHFSSNWFSYFLISWLPTYLQVARHFSLQRMAVGSALPFLSALCATNLFGFLLDRLSGGRDRTRVSKMFLLAFAGAALILLLISHASSPALIVFLLCLSAALMTASTPIYASGALNLVPRFAGSFVGVQNSIANLAGVLAPVVTGYLAASRGWNVAFAFTAAICILGISAYLLMGTAERETE